MIRIIMKDSEQLRVVLNYRLIDELNIVLKRP